MNRELIIRPEAEAELAEAFEWYEARVAGLGLEFIRAVDSLFNSIICNPQAFPVVYKSVHRALTRKSPMRSSSWLMLRALLFLLYFMPSVIPSAGTKESEAHRTIHSSGWLTAPADLNRWPWEPS
jgi:hypothetical protein